MEKVNLNVTIKAKQNMNEEAIHDFRKLVFAAHSVSNASRIVNHIDYHPLQQVFENNV